jgi:putative aminopeptidase FrvX
MTDILPFLKSLLSVSGLSAYETPVANLIEARWKPLVDETSLSRLGSLHGLKHGSGKPPRSSVMIATHMDAIGLMVTKITDGFLHITEIGGIDPRVLPGTPVIVHATGGGGSMDLPGVVVMPPENLLPEGIDGKAIPLKYLLVDTGLPAGDVSRRVVIGDLAAYNTEPLEMAGENVSGHALDNRASIAALTICLEELQAKSHIWDLWAAATTQEEISLGGGKTSAFQIRPNIAIAVDMTYGRAPGMNDWETFVLGKGPTLGTGANIHPYLYKRFAELAEKLEIPFSVEAMPGFSGTDAEAMQLAAQGIPTMVVSIPLRYMHTPVEVVALKDIQRTGRLLAEFVTSLQADFFEKIVWDPS